MLIQWLNHAGSRLATTDEVPSPAQRVCAHAWIARRRVWRWQDGRIIAALQGGGGEARRVRRGNAHSAPESH